MLRKIKTFENFNTQIEIPPSIVDDIEKSGYSVVSFHPHHKYYMIKIRKVADQNFDPKDFSRFNWVVDNHSSNNGKTEFSIKAKF